MAKPIDLEIPLIATLLPPPKLRRIQEALGQNYALVQADDVTHLNRILARHDLDVVIIDPIVDAAGGHHVRTHLSAFAEVERRRAEFIVYVEPAKLRDVLPVVWTQRAFVLLSSVDDSPQVLRETIAAAVTRRSVGEVLNRLEPAMQRLSDSTRAAIYAHFRGPSSVESVDHFAQAAGANRRTLERELREAGFATPQKLIVAGRVILAYSLLRLTRARVRDIGDLVGRKDSRGLRRDLDHVLGEYHLQAVRTLDLNTFVRCLVRFVAPHVDALRGRGSIGHQSATGI